MRFTVQKFTLLRALAVLLSSVIFGSFLLTTYLAFSAQASSPGAIQKETSFAVKNYRLEKDRLREAGISSEPATQPVIALVPHPDDEALGFSGTLSAFAASGVPVRVYLLSNGTGSKLAGRWVRRHRSLKYDLNGDGAIDANDFGLARQAEFKDSMRRLGIKEEALVFLDEHLRHPDSHLGPQGPPADTSTDEVSSCIVEDCAQHDFPLTGDTRVITVAPFLGASKKGKFFGENLTACSQAHSLHQLCACIATRLPDIEPRHIYFFKVYAHNARLARRPAAPLHVLLSDQERKARNGALKAYRRIGRPSATNVFRGASRSLVEYGATFAQIKEAGLSVSEQAPTAPCPFKQGKRPAEKSAFSR